MLVLIPSRRLNGNISFKNEAPIIKEKKKSDLPQLMHDTLVSADAHDCVKIEGRHTNVVTEDRSLSCM